MKPTQTTSSIKRKVMTAIMVTAVTVLLLMMVGFMVYDLLSFRRTMVQNLTIQGQIVAGNSGSALAFKIESDAEDVLHSLTADPHITAAALYDADGKIFAKYPPDRADSALPATPGAEGASFGRAQLTLFQAIYKSGRRLGTLYLQSDLRAIYTRLELYGVISLFIMLGSLLVAFWLSNTMQKRIANPIIALAATARQISEQRDYSVRAKTLSTDELGALTDSFNHMLSRIQASDLALRASEAQFRLVTDKAPVLLAQMDPNCHYKFVNQPYAARYGREPQDVVGKHALEIVGAEVFEKALPYVKQALAGRPVQYEMETPHASGGSRWSHVEYSPELSPSGEVVSFVAVHTDITARKFAELEIAQARDQALEASRAKDDFLAALSHELRTPLSPVLLLASEAASNSQLPPEVRNSFEIISQNVALEARLIDDLLDLTRITRNKLSLDLQITDLHVVLQNAINTVAAEIERKKIALTVHLSAAQTAVMGDAVRLQQIFWNVLKNAVKFTPENGKISVATQVENHQLRVTITDTGIGMTQPELNRVFEAFAQGDHSIGSGSHRFGGLGLGLAISQKLVHLHAGVIHAASKGRDLGATFVITLPLPSPAETGAVSENSGSPAQPVPSVSAGFRILLVEDHEPTRLALTQLLKHRHHEVLVAGSLAEAREIARREKFDVLISDIGLPDGTGNDLMKEFRERYGVKGIALTGYGMEDDIIRSQTAGFNAHLTKPVHVRALEAALARVSA